MKSTPAGQTSEVVARLLQQGDSQAASELAALAESGEKAIAKEAKRALFQLGQRGIMPAALESAPSVSRPGLAPANRALLSSVGGTGSRMLWFVRDDPYGGSPTVMSYLTNDQTGVVDFKQRKTPRRELQQRMEDLKSQENTVIVDAPLDYARFLLAQAAERNRRGGAPLPQGYGDAHRYIGQPERDYPLPLIYELLSADEIRKDAAIPRAPEKLFEMPWFEAWLLDFQSVEPWETRYFEAVSSRLLIDESQRAKRGDAIIDEAADALLNTESAALFKQRLEDTALALHLAGHIEQARQTFYHALTLEEFKTPHENPFLRTLVHRSIFLVIAYKAQLEEQEEESRTGPGPIQRI